MSGMFPNFYPQIVVLGETNKKGAGRACIPDDNDNDDEAAEKTSPYLRLNPAWYFSISHNQTPLGKIQWRWRWEWQKKERKRETYPLAEACQFWGHTGAPSSCQPSPPYMNQHDEETELSGEYVATICNNNFYTPFKFWVILYFNSGNGYVVVVEVVMTKKLKKWKGAFLLWFWRIGDVLIYCNILFHYKLGF